jgi:predicted amidophosphoribosyltransferase
MDGVGTDRARVAGGWLGGLADLLFAAGCAGCGGAGRGSLCDACRAELAAAVPGPTRPTPAPPGLPPCYALSGYAGVLREVLIGYKDRGRYPLASPLGALLADVVAGTGVPRSRPVLLVPVPDTPAAARARYGDHLRRLADAASRVLRRAGWSAATAPVLSARPRADSAGLDSAARARAAQQAFRPRPRALAALAVAAGTGAAVVVVDDILTTGATLAAATLALTDAGVPVHAAAVLAATRRTRDL